uniref:SFRICE_013635 n=1 Tax=Spodoptera frugiperda TaxID=7108 RepID=A0A2H1V3P5_SPOFR
MRAYKIDLQVSCWPYRGKEFKGCWRIGRGVTGSPITSLTQRKRCFTSVFCEAVETVVKQRLRCVSEGTGGPITTFPNTRFPKNTSIPNLQKVSNALVKPLVFRVSMGGSDFLPSELKRNTPK